MIQSNAITLTGAEASARLGRPDTALSGRVTKLICFSATHRDDPSYLEWLRDYEVIKTLDLPAYVAEPVSQETVADYCDRLMNSSNDLFLAIHDCEDDQFIGTIKAGHINWYALTADIGIMVGDRTRWGRGLARDAIHTLCHYLFNDVGLRRLTAGAMAVNPAMIHVFEKLGFKREGIFRDQDRFEDGFCDHIHLGCFAEELKLAG
ncbi:MAG TPA: hypothetical protein DCS82_08485 [Rhodospirillaceae bacterium]|nr:hypothetical protein [Rhodospirillaceae bacterium]HAA91893.1 hypothetical protein [Rhodospirillaceae bacterium]HAT35739.1 hypothetical protein [Rhodospirillaceae bacterium]